MKAKLAFYKGKGNLVDKSIRWYTNSRYSHVELVIGDDWYSTSPRDLEVRCKKIVPTEGNWDFVDIEIDIDYVLELYNNIKGAKYDWLGIALSQFISIGIHSESKWFCSEFVMEALAVKNSNKYSPEDVYKFATTGKEK